MRSYLCAAAALFLFFFHTTAHAQKKTSWERIADAHWVLELPEFEVSITVMEFGSTVVVLWEWPCKNAESTRNLMQRADGTIKISGGCWPKSPSISYDSLLIGLKEALNISTPPTELLILLSQMSLWSEEL